MESINIDGKKMYVIDCDKPLDVVKNPSFTIDQEALDRLDGKDAEWHSQQKSASITFEIDGTMAMEMFRFFTRELNKSLPRLPRKLKKKCKKTMFLRYPKRISKWLLLEVYATSTKKTWYLKNHGITKEKK